MIPVRNRDWQVERAIKSICDQADSGQVEIIVVDDASDQPVSPISLRPCDRLIRMPKNVGAAVCRNVGIREAQGKVVYLLDSDDYFVSRNFSLDAQEVVPGVLYYSDIRSQGYASNFPDEIAQEVFFDYVFFKYRFIAQTSSLFFAKEGGFLFDESLPKHQDWDFVYCTALLSGHQVKRRNGVCYFDRSDQQSISRVSSENKSMVWFQKLSKIELIDDVLMDYIHYNLFARTKALSLAKVLIGGVGYALKQRLGWTDLLRIFCRRVVA